MATDKPVKKKRRIRPSSETVRQKTDKVRAAAAEPKKPVKQKKERVVLKKLWRPFHVMLRPVRWLGRHIIPRYFKEAFNELRATTWPNRKQSRQLTTAVVLFAIVFGALVSTLDYGLDKVFKKVFLKE